MDDKNKRLSISSDEFDIIRRALTTETRLPVVGGSRAKEIKIRKQAAFDLLVALTTRFEGC